MRDIKDIKADIEKLEFLNGDEPIIANLWLEYYRTLSANIPLDRLEQICNAERDGRLHISNTSRNIDIQTKIERVESE